MAYNKVTVAYFDENCDARKCDVDSRVANLTITLNPIHSGWLVEYSLWLESDDFIVEEKKRHATLQLVVRVFSNVIPNVCVPKKHGVIVFIKGANADTSYNPGDGEWRDLEGSMKLFVNEGRSWIHLESKDLVANIPYNFQGYIYPMAHRQLTEDLITQSGIKLATPEIYKHPSPVLGEYAISSVIFV